HTQNRWVIALKLIRSERLATPQATRQFLHELEAMMQLAHPNIITVCDADQVRQTYYCAMQYVEGTDLGQFVRLAGRLHPAHARGYIRQSVLGLQHAYEHNMVHRDIKPSNLFLTVTGGRTRANPQNETKEPAPSPKAVIKILDWGLATLRFPKGYQIEADQEAAGRGVSGTADYASPDQAPHPATL